LIYEFLEICICISIQANRYAIHWTKLVFKKHFYLTSKFIQLLPKAILSSILLKLICFLSNNDGRSLFPCNFLPPCAKYQWLIDLCFFIKTASKQPYSKQGKFCNFGVFLKHRFRYKCSCHEHLAFHILIN
jgi:hypothetical protein